MPSLCPEWHVAEVGGFLHVRILVRGVALLHSLVQVGRGVAVEMGPRDLEICVEAAAIDLFEGFWDADAGIFDEVGDHLFDYVTHYEFEFSLFHIRWSLSIAFWVQKANWVYAFLSLMRFSSSLRSMTLAS